MHHKINKKKFNETVKWAIANKTKTRTNLASQLDVGNTQLYKYMSGTKSKASSVRTETRDKLVKNFVAIGVSEKDAQACFKGRGTKAPHRELFGKEIKAKVAKANKNTSPTTNDMWASIEQTLKATGLGTLTFTKNNLKVMVENV